MGVLRRPVLDDFPESHWLGRFDVSNHQIFNGRPFSPRVTLKAFTHHRPYKFLGLRFGFSSVWSRVSLIFAANLSPRIKQVLYIKYSQLRARKVGLSIHFILQAYRSRASLSPLYTPISPLPLRIHHTNVWDHIGRLTKRFVPERQKVREPSVNG